MQGGELAAADEGIAADAVDALLYHHLTQLRVVERSIREIVGVRYAAVHVKLTRDIDEDLAA